MRASLSSIPDPDDLVEPRVVHHGPRSVQEQAPRRRRRRHWKVKDWKRRTAQRRERALAMRRMAQEQEEAELQPPS